MIIAFISKISGKEARFFLSVLLIMAGLFLSKAQTPDSWSSIGDVMQGSYSVPEIPTNNTLDAASFVINDIAYVATGWGTDFTYTRSVRAYDPLTRTWMLKNDLPVAMSTRKEAIGFSLNGIGYIGLGSNQGGNLNDLWRYNPTTDTWTSVTVPVGVTISGAGASCFVIKRHSFLGGDLAYIGIPNGSVTDFYEFDGTNFRNVGDIPVPLKSTTSFAIGGFGYVGNGFLNTTPFPAQNNFYKFDFIAGSWSSMATSFPGSGGANNKGAAANGLGFVFSQNATYSFNPSTSAWATLTESFPGLCSVEKSAPFVLRDSVYVFCTGRQVFALSGNTLSWTSPNWGHYKSYDFRDGALNYLVTNNGITLEFNPASNTWIRKRDMPSPRVDGASFVLNNKLYISTGSFTKDLWEYNPVSDIWTQKANLPFSATPRTGAVGYALNGKGYVRGGFCSNCSGPLNELWEYDPSLDSWTLITGIQGNTSEKSFYINNRPYVIGQNHSFGSSYMYNPDPTSLSGFENPPYAQHTVLFSIGERGYLATGSTSGVSHNVFLYEYDAIGDHWEQRADLPANPRLWASGFTQPDKGFLGGGDQALGMGVYGKDWYQYHPHRLISSPLKTTWIRTETVIQVPFNTVNPPSFPVVYDAVLSDGTNEYIIGSLSTNTLGGFISSVIPETVTDGVYQIYVRCLSQGWTSPSNGKFYQVWGGGASLAFNGMNSEIQIPDGLQLADEPFTIEFKMQELNTTAYESILSFGDAINPIEIGIDAAGNVGFDFDGTPLLYQLTNRNQPNHLAFVYSGSTSPTDNRKIYLNGVLVASDFIVPTFNQTDSLFVIGRSLLSPGTAQLSVILDELRIWRSERTEQEILDYMDCEISPTSENLRAYYRFNDGSEGFVTQPQGAEICTDETGGKNGILINFEDPVSGLWQPGYQPSLVTGSCEVEVEVSTAFVSYCAESSANVSYNIQGLNLNQGNTFSIQISDTTGSFGGQNITVGFTSGTDLSGSIPVSFQGVQPGSGYRIRLVTSDPYFEGEASDQSLEIAEYSSPSVSISSNANNACAGSVIQLTATPTGSGLNPVFQWFVNGLPTDSTGSTFTRNSFSNNDAVSVVVTSSAVCSSPAQAADTLYIQVQSSLSWYLDADNDGRYVNTQSSCTSPGAGWTSTLPSGGSGDCDDNNNLVYTTPSAAGSISGSTSVTSGASGLVYSVGSIAQASSYNWSVPAGWTITSGAGTNSITVTAGTSGGTISVYGVNSCGNGTASSISVSIGCTAPAQPGTISGTTAVCQGTVYNYSIASVNGATSYTWTVPASWTIQSGQGTTGIQVLVGSAGTSISVRSVNACGTSSNRNLSVSRTNLPSAAGAITGSTNPSSGSSQVYSVAAISGSTGYNWSFPSGWVVTAGANTRTITVTVGSASGSITVAGTNSCGSGASSSLNVTVPCTPVTWYLDADNDSWYVNTQSSCTSPGTGWTNTLPSGGSSDCDDNNNQIWQSANLYVDADNDGYSNGEQLVCFGATIPAGYKTTTLGNDCNDANASINPGATEVCGNGIDDNCNGSTDEGCAIISGLDTVCASASNTYSVSGVSGATAFTWSASPSTGVTISGTSQTTKTVKITTGGTFVITALPNNGQPAVTKTILVRALPTGGRVSGPKPVCMGGTGTYTVSNMTNVTNYTWSAPSGASVLSSNGNSATYQFGTGSSYTISVRGSNGGCLAASSKTYAVTTIAQPTGGSISGSGTVCLGTSGTYSVIGMANTTTATTYTWTASNGATMSGSGTSRTITFPNTGTSIITVQASQGGCSSPVLSLNVTVNSAPTAKYTVSGSSTSCEGQTKSYTTASTAGVTYTWSVVPSNGGTITAGQGTNAASMRFNGTYANASNPVTVSMVPSIGSCAKAASTKAVTVNKYPSGTSISTTPDTACTGQTVICTASSTNAATYTWSISGAANAGSGSTNTRIITMGTKNIVVKVTPKNGSCSGSQVSRTVIYKTSGCGAKEGAMEMGEEKMEVNMQFYPNPTGGDYQLSVSGLESDEEFNMSWLDATGREVSREYGLRTGSGTVLSRSAGDLPAGLYVVKLQSANRNLTVRVTVE